MSVANLWTSSEGVIFVRYKFLPTALVHIILIGIYALTYTVEFMAF